MHVVVSSSRVVFHHCIISFVIVGFGFVVVLGVSLHVCFYLTRPLFVLYSMHVIPLLIVCYPVCFSALPQTRYSWLGGCFFYTIPGS